MDFRGTAALLAVLASCGGAGVDRFPLRDPLLRDDDMRPYRPRPATYFSPLLWDGLDMLAFRPVARFFAVDPGGEAVNVNALDEVPDSSWFQNRLGARPMSVDEMVRGSCAVPPLDPVGPWKVIAAKPNGASPGFTVEGEDGLRYLVKFDGDLQPVRASAADVIGSRIYHAAGFNTPCNELVYFRREIVRIAPDAQVEDGSGKKIPLTEQAIDDIVKQTSRLPDGRYRAVVSLFLSGEPLGPFRYLAVRKADFNDVVRHEDRRELRGSYLLAAWIHHFDAREMNSLDTWIEVPGQGGYVRHHILDWGDSLGVVWPWDEMTRRIGHAYYFDFSNMFYDFFTLGVPARPWDRARYGPAGIVWAYFDVETFDPERYHPGYPNPAFMRMTEHDGAWMARILAGFTDEHIAALADLAVLPDPVLRSELIRILRGRRDKILTRYLGRLSALTRPRLRDGELCVDDLAVAAGVAPRAERHYAARAWTEGGDANRSLTVHPDGAAALCVALPPAVGPRRYVIVDVLSYAPHARRQAPLRVHLYDLGEAGARIVGLERPDDDAAPRN